MWKATVLAVVCCAAACAAIEGAAVWSAGEVVAWGGDGVHLWQRDRGFRRLARGRFEEGGCVAEFAGRRGVAVQTRSRGMVWLEGPAWRPVTIDSGLDARDCLGAVLFGREGLLVVHRGAQIRFYERPAAGVGGRWPYRELYSIYTASWQGGLRMVDMNGDGRPDLLCGNYWVESPERFEEPWRLYPIHNWWETPVSAAVRLAAGERVWAAQRDLSPARIAWFERPANARDLWTAHAGPADLRRVRAFDERGGRLLAGEDAGEGSRLVVIEDGRAREIERGPGYVFAAWRDAGEPAVVVSRSGVRWQEIGNN